VTEWGGDFESLLRPMLPLLAADVEITPELDLIAAGLDSFALVELLIQIEEHYGIRLSDDLVAQEMFATPSTLWSTISPFVGGR
jgi:diaminopimelate decarboxylase